MYALANSCTGKITTILVRAVAASSIFVSRWTRSLSPAIAYFLVILVLYLTQLTAHTNPRSYTLKALGLKPGNMPSMMKDGRKFALNVDARRYRLATAVGESHIDPELKK